jgi:hypothetical protein
MKIYIAGKISGTEEHHFTSKFRIAEELLREAGWEPVNPVKFGLPGTMPTSEALIICLPALLECMAIYMLHDWKDSVGSVVEHSMAKHNGLKIFYQEWHSCNYMLTALKELNQSLTP